MKINLDRHTATESENEYYYFSVKFLKINEKAIGFPFKMDYGNVRKLHLADNWVSTGLNVALEKHSKTNLKSTYWPPGDLK